MAADHSLSFFLSATNRLKLRLLLIISIASTLFFVQNVYDEKKFKNLKKMNCFSKVKQNVGAIILYKKNIICRKMIGFILFASVT